MKAKLSPYLKLKRIEFLATYQCTGRCKHCSVAPRLNQAGGERHIRAAEAAEAVGALAALYEIESVMTFGGEPLLCADAVCAIHQRAADCGIPSRQVITNGYFTKNAERRRKVADDLVRAGVNRVLVSVDAFHQETIPWEAVAEFARDAQAAGMEGLTLHPSWVVNRAHPNPYNAETEAILKRFSGIPIDDGNDIFPSGNAAVYLNEYYEACGPDLSARCGTKPYTEPLTEITSLSIAPGGDGMVCGFAIGNIYSEPVYEIVARYDPTQNDAMRAILEGGVPALLAYAEGKGVRVELSRYRSACDVCHAVASRIC